MLTPTLLELLLLTQRNKSLMRSVPDPLSPLWRGWHPGGHGCHSVHLSHLSFFKLIMYTSRLVDGYVPFFHSRHLAIGVLLDSGVEFVQKRLTLWAIFLCIQYVITLINCYTHSSEASKQSDAYRVFKSTTFDKTTTTSSVIARDTLHLVYTLLARMAVAVLTDCTLIILTKRKKIFKWTFRVHKN